MIREQPWFAEYESRSTEALVDLVGSGDFFTRLHALAALAFRVDTDTLAVSLVGNALRDPRNDHPKIFGMPMPVFVMVALSEANGAKARRMFFERFHELSDRQRADITRLVAPEFLAS